MKFSLFSGLNSENYEWDGKKDATFTSTLEKTDEGRRRLDQIEKQREYERAKQRRLKERKAAAAAAAAATAAAAAAAAATAAADE